MAEWESVLKLATMWEISSLRERAIKNLDKVGLQSVEKIRLGESYMMGRWLFRGLYELANAEGGMDVETMTCLGHERVNKLWQIREKKWKADETLESFTTYRDGSYYCGLVDQVFEDVREVFGFDLLDAGLDPAKESNHAPKSFHDQVREPINSAFNLLGVSFPSAEMRGRGRGGWRGSRGGQRGRGM